LLCLYSAFPYTFYLLEKICELCLSFLDPANAVGIGCKLGCDSGRNVLVEVIFIKRKGVGGIGDGIEGRGV
jgi:hypothetical protein